MENFLPNIKILLVWCILIYGVQCRNYYYQATTTPKQFSSPNYPLNYPNNIENVYNIKTDPGYGIRIEFMTFSLESSILCNYDFVTVYEGSFLTGQEVDTYCGATNPNDYSSYKDEINIRFKTDSSSTSGGFLITYNAYELDTNTDGDLSISEIIGIIIGIIIVIIIICVLIALLNSNSKRRRVMVRQQPNVAMVTHTNQQHGVTMVAQPTHGYIQGQPSYGHQVTMVTGTHNQGQGQPMGPPPPYSAVHPSGVPPPFVYYPPNTRNDNNQARNTKY